MRQADNRQTIKYFVALILLWPLGFSQWLLSRSLLQLCLLAIRVLVRAGWLGTRGCRGRRALVALDVKFSVCKTEENIAKGLDVADTSFGGLSLVAGNKEEIANLTTRIKTMEALIVCYQVLLASIKAVPTPNLFLGQKNSGLKPRRFYR